MKKTTYVHHIALALCLAAPLVAAVPLAVTVTGCAEEAPPLPAGASIKSLRFSARGDMYIDGWCMTCCDEWVPGPDIGCDPEPGGGGDGPYPHPWCPDVFCNGP